MIRAAVYVRVSGSKRAAQAHQQTGDRAYEQNPDVQKAQILDLCRSRGWEVAEVYMDRASGARESRPGLERLMADARRRKFDLVVVFRFDRFARSTKQLLLALEEFRSLGVDFVSVHESLDTSTPMGKAMFTIIAALAEFERELIRERIVAGMEYAARCGTKSGKPSGRPRRIFDRQKARSLRAEGLSWAKLSEAMGVSASTLRRALKESG